MKTLEEICADCPSRTLLPDIAALMRHITTHFPEIAKQVKHDGMSPMFAAVVVMRTQAQLIEELEDEKIPGVNCNESD